jgi:hypothetical protein
MADVDPSAVDTSVPDIADRPVTLADAKRLAAARKAGAVPPPAQQAVAGVSQPPPIPTSTPVREPGGQAVPVPNAAPSTGGVADPYQRMLIAEVMSRPPDQLDPELVRSSLALGPQNIAAERAKAQVAALRGKKSEHSNYAQRGGWALAIGDAVSDYADRWRLHDAEKEQAARETELGAAKQKAGEEYIASSQKREAERQARIDRLLGDGPRSADAMPTSKLQGPVASNLKYGDIDLSKIDISKLLNSGG